MLVPVTKDDIEDALLAYRPTLRRKIEEGPKISVQVGRWRCPTIRRSGAGKRSSARDLPALSVGKGIIGSLIFRHCWSTLLIMSYQDRITIDPAQRGGKPCIRGLRITVYDVLEYLASGMNEGEILNDFPDLTREDIRACLEFAADRERKLVSFPSR